MGSNGNVPERLAEAEAAARVLGAAWRENLRWPDRRIGKDPAHLDAGGRVHPAPSPAVVAMPYWSDRHPDHVAASEVLTEAVFNAGLRRYPADGERVEARLDLLLLHQRQRARRRSSSTCRTTTSASGARSTATPASSRRRPRTARCATRLTTPLFRQLIESRDAQFGALAGVRCAEGFVVREPVAARTACCMKRLP